MKMRRGSLVQAVAVLLFVVFPINAQEVPTPQEVDQENGLVRLFMDCQGGGCWDSDFFRTEIQFVNWVRDRRDADLHLLITSQPTGAGGRSYDLFFIGQERFDSMSDTLAYISGYDATSDEVRNGLAGIIKIGLMRFVGLTSVAKDISIGMGRAGGPGQRGGPRPGPGEGGMATPDDDPWNFWVFRTSASGHGMGESTFGSLGLSGSFSASRTTEDWKASFRIRTSYNENSFEYSVGDEEITSLTVRRTHSFTGLLVKSLTDHWSAGLRSGVSSSTFTNHNLAVDVAPVLEYNIFPYAESTRRSLTLQYALEGNYFDYVEETVYFQESEFLVGHSVAASLDFNQPWGSANIHASAGHFLKDIDLHNLGIGGSINVRLARGFSVNVGGSVSRIQDRINVALDPASVEDVLLQRKQLQTNYSYFTHVGLNYTFGSIFNNVVNPRIGGSSGGGMIIIG
jgi:hypothetical protein